MRLPPFKITGQHGAQLRYVGAATPHEPFPRCYYAGRRSVCVAHALLCTIAGTGSCFEIRLRRGSRGDGPWHDIDATPDEAREYLLRSPLMKGRVRAAERIRERREHRQRERVA